MRSGIAGACQWQRTGGGRLPEEPQVTGSCGYVDDVGADHFSDFESSAATLAVSENLFDLLSYYVSRPVLRNLGAFKK